MAPRPKRSIIHRPVDKLSQLVYYGPKGACYGSSYNSSFLSADKQTYESGHIRPVIDGYYSRVKEVIEESANAGTNVTIGEQRNLGTVKNLRETKRQTHGVITTSSTDIRKIMFPGHEEGDVEESHDEEVAQLKCRIHGVKSNSDPTGGRTWKALKYESCVSSGEEVEEDDNQRLSKNANRSRTHKATFKRKANFIANQDLDEQFLLLQEAIQYLNKIRSTLIKIDKSAIDACRKTSSAITCAQDAVEMLSSKSTVLISYSQLDPIIEKFNLKTTDAKSIQKLWDLFDHHIPLAEFKFGRLVKPFPEEHSPEELVESKPAQSTKQQEHLELRLKARKFKDYDTAGDLISPRPSTPFGLSHVDYFLPRVHEEIKTIFRNFNLDERAFEDAWQEARKLETCEMNKVSAENFKTILNKKGVKLLHGL